MDKVKNFFIDTEQSTARQHIVNQTYEFDSNQVGQFIHQPTCIGDNAVLVGADVFEDLELFKPYRDGCVPVMDAIDKTLLRGSRLYMQHLLSHPIHCVELLQKRQELLKALKPSTASMECLRTMQSSELDVLWLFENPSDNIKSLQEMVYFRFWVTKHLNNVGAALSTYNIYRMVLSPLIGIISPVVYFIVPFLVLRFRYGLKLPFKTYINVLFQSSGMLFKLNGWSDNLKYCSYVFTLLFYFQSAINSVEVSRTLYCMTDYIISKVNNISKFISSGNALVQEHSSTINEVANIFYGVTLEASGAVINPPTQLHDVWEKWWIASNFGSLLSFYKNIDKKAVSDLLSRVYMIDTLCSISSLKNDMNYDYVDYVHDSKPKLHLVGAWHPSIANAIPNDTIIGVHMPNNAVITGPNAGGKSTMIKSVVLNTLLAQTLTVCCCRSFCMTPFAFINTQINIPDCKGKESLFQAEMNRCKNNIDVTKSMGENRFSLIVMDEIFNSTSPVEGIAAAYAVAAHLGRLPRVVMLFTTHYSYLTKLAKTMAFTNYKMNVKMLPGGRFEYPYKMKRGISRQHIALDLLETNGFDAALIAEAKEIRDKLCV
jgi:hypothetical protein